MAVASRSMPTWPAQGPGARLPGPDASGRLLRGDERSRDSRDTVRRRCPPGRALPCGAGGRGNPERGTARSGARAAAAESIWSLAGASPALSRRSAHCAAGLARPSLSASPRGVGAEVGPDKTLWLAWETASRTLQVIGRLLSVPLLKCFAVGSRVSRSRTVSHCNLHQPKGVMMPFLCVES